jgi:sialidase-1
MTVRLSYDEGTTWPVSKTVYAGPSAYSCLTVLKDGTIGLFYETGKKGLVETISFARFNLEWLSDETDRLQKQASEAGSAR